jgi:hypothetical protein
LKQKAKPTAIDHRRAYVLSSAAWRHLMCSAFSGRLPLYIVAEYPRSGGTWFGQLLSESLGIPFPRQTAPRYESCVMHGHYLYSQRFKNVTCIVRDGRDVMISLYYQLLFCNDRNDPRRVEALRRRLSYPDFEDIRTNLPHFMAWLFDMDGRRYSPYRSTWSRWVEDWYGHWQVLVRYEDLLGDTRTELARALDALGANVSQANVNRAVERCDFHALTGRRPGQADISSSARSGIAGEWRNVFSDKAMKDFAELAGDELVLLGYESDHSWARDARE